MIKLLSTENLNEAEITRQMLEENSVDVVLLNKQDSSYLMFGNIELYVKENQLKKAISLIKYAENARNT
tara:strand:+ start:1143 stop:1349 length:207 start_codon:yes stop_codon:yes gene_type:complete